MTARDPGTPTGRPPTAGPAIRAAEVVVGALSLATDLGTGQPLEHAMRTAIIAVRLGELAGATPRELQDTYYVALLHSAGCTSDGPEAVQLYGDDIVPRAAFALVDAGSIDEVVAFFQANVGVGRDPETRAAMIADVLANGLPVARRTLAMHCEVAQRFAGWLGFGAGVQAALEHVFERWDGHGLPGVTAGADLPLPIRLLHIARDVSAFISASGPEAAVAMVARRSGGAYEPRLAELTVAALPGILVEIDETRLWAAALDAEPHPLVWLAGERIDAAFEAMAAFVDLKSTWYRVHSASVAELAEAVGWRMGLPAPIVTGLRRAALAHDLGRAGVSNSIWEKPGPLGFGEWERVRLHSHWTERAFAQSVDLAPIGRLAGAHHERLDGSGYHRGVAGPGAGGDPCAGILAAADAWTAMREARPWRAALKPAAAAAELEAAVDAGRLVRDVVDALLATVGERATRRPTPRPAAADLPGGLTDRELDVLRVLVLGRTNQEIADALGISARTVDTHIGHIYAKAGVRSRAGATLWAFQHDLVPTA